MCAADDWVVDDSDCDDENCEAYQQVYLERTRQLMEKVMGHAPDAPQGKLFNTPMGMPLFWQERKPHKCWKALLQDVHAKCIVWRRTKKVSPQRPAVWFAPRTRVVEPVTPAEFCRGEPGGMANQFLVVFTTHLEKDLSISMDRPT